MQRVQTYVDNQLVYPAEINDIQDDAASAAGVWGLMLGGDTLYSLNGTTIFISRIRALVMGATGVVASTSGQSVFTPTTDVGTSASIVANTWYFIYAWINAGVITFECDSTPPDSDRIFKSTDTSRRYVGSFHTFSGSTQVHQFTANRGRYQYRFSAMPSSEAGTTAGAPFVVLSSTTTVAAANVAVDAMVPTTASLVEVFMQLQGSGGGASTPTLTVIPSGTPDAANGGFPLGETLADSLAASASAFRQQYLELPIGSFGSLPSHAGLKAGLATSNSAAGLIMVSGYRE